LWTERGLGGAADQVGRFALLLSAREFDRSLFGELVVGDLLLFPALAAMGGVVGGVALRLELLPPARRSACPSCLVRKEEEPDAGGAGGDRVAEDEVVVAELDVGQRAYADDRDHAAGAVLREARTHGTTLETKEDEMPLDDQLEFIHKLERLAGYVGKEPDDDFRDLIAEIQDEFNLLKRGAVRDGLETDERLTAQDVFNLGAEIGQDFPEAQKGCEVFVSAYFIEKIESAPLN
jgi:hypothetical protein